MKSLIRLFLLGTETRRNALNIFLEYAPGGSLRQLLQERGQALDEETAARYMHQVTATTKPGVNNINFSNSVKYTKLNIYVKL